METRRCVQRGRPCKDNSASRERAFEGLMGASRTIENFSRGCSEHVNYFERTCKFPYKPSVALPKALRPSGQPLRLSGPLHSLKALGVSCNWRLILVGHGVLGSMPFDRGLSNE